MSDPDLSARAPTAPPYRALALVSLLLCVPLVWPLFGGRGVGAFRMFTQLQYARLAIAVGDGGESGDGRGLRALPVAQLAPHLSLDARRIVVAAERELAGETAASLLAEGLPDLARLACEVSRARRAEVRLTRRGLLRELPPLQVALECDARTR